MLAMVGFDQHGSSTGDRSTLFHEGDICYPATSPFIFVSPVTDDGQRVDFTNYDDELTAVRDLLGIDEQTDDEIVSKSPEKNWWQFWK
jgi:hypothetical protein